MTMTTPIIRKDKDGKEYRDFPFEEITAKVIELAKQGDRCYQKFSCEKCGERLGIDRANTFYETGSCDKCGHITNIKERGCNFMLIARLR